ncbi:2-dehydropantoate 2-reductase [Neptunicella marina]|uniref:2-dehydropantoate 2-reductase n=1 Tax=Neptunicella marina TaxID=2125989 RepID=A0A8J6LXD8_9ALTE|nr:2-dehydropantoate 2-reductase [Neptunicella marina]MBC3764720.1 2-dehydropantoate 2-reductase [Neptunicella marina]
MKQHLVFGAGLIGTYIGCMLNEMGCRVSLIGRQLWLEQFDSTFSLTDYQQHQLLTALPNWQDLAGKQVSNKELKKADIVWLTVKCTGLESALHELIPFVHPDTTIVACQNGLGSDVLIQQFFPANKLLKAIVGFNVVKTDSGLHKSTEGDLYLETGDKREGEQLASLFNHPLFLAKSIDNIEAMQWAKLQLNLANAVNAVADIPVKQMLLQRPYRQIIAQLMRELLAVTNEKQLTLPQLTRVKASWLPGILSLPDWLFKRVANQMLQIDEDAYTSMWWDIKNNKRTEIDFLNSQLVKQAELVDIATPVNRRLVKLVRDIEAGITENGIGAASLHNMLLSPVNNRSQS